MAALVGACFPHFKPTSPVKGARDSFTPCIRVRLNEALCCVAGKSDSNYNPALEPNLEFDCSCDSRSFLARSLSIIKSFLENLPYLKGSSCTLYQTCRVCFPRSLSQSS